MQPTVFGKAIKTIGAAMMWAWTLIIGVLGFVLLLGVYYAMVAQSQSLLVVCCFFLALPILLTVVFGSLSLAELTVQRLARNQTSTGMVRATSRADV